MNPVYRIIHTNETNEKLDVKSNGQVDRASVTEMVDSGLIPGWVKTEDYKTRYLQLPCLMFSN